MPPDRRVIAFIAVWLAVQLAVPAYGLLQPRPARFGWQMYTALTELPSVTVRYEDGSEAAVEVENRVARGRAEADYIPALHDKLCLDAAVEAIVVTLKNTKDVLPCS